MGISDNEVFWQVVALGRDAVKSWSAQNKR
jgi:hypothetical protein